MVTAIILAAGASRRMGRPKALLPYRGETFLNRLIRIAGQVAGSTIVVVGPPYAGRIRKRAITGPLFAANPEPERGQLSSLQIALAQLPPEAEGFFFIPVDCPAVREETVRRLATAFARRDPQTLFVIPRYGDRRGHPVFAARSVASEFLALPVEAQARDVVHRHVSRTFYVEVEDRGILADIDDFAAYRELVEAAGGELARPSPSAEVQLARPREAPLGRGFLRR
ncbi:MAG TPA: nucleotidyltransferase family protein [Bryobacteraceae bacterium]|nr:nucleotidyltransferase family protein [Bryobacteraceae bacterium]